MPPSSDLLASYFTIAGNIIPVSGHTVSPFDFRARAEAAAQAGFRGFGFFDTDLAAVVRDYGLHSIRSILTENGFTCVECELQSFPWYAEPAERDQYEPALRAFFDAVEGIGCHHIKVGGCMERSFSVDHMIEAFADLCDRAAAVGTRVGFEMVPFTNVPDLATTRAIVEGADRPGGGYMLDIWHICRGKQSLAELALLPAARICGVELSDAAAEVRGTLLEDTLHQRRFCGEGDFDISAFIKAIDVTGYEGMFGIEILSDEIRLMTLPDAAKRAFDTTARAVSRARAAISGR
jgi:sugar phosphate isomerase/epimerase